MHYKWGAKLLFLLYVWNNFFWAQQSFGELLYSVFHLWLWTWAEGISDDQSFTKVIIRKDEKLYSVHFVNLVKQEPWISRISPLLSEELGSEH